MATLAIDDLTLLECPACDGVWMGATEFDRICAEHEAQAAVLNGEARRRHHRDGVNPLSPVHDLRKDDEPRQFWPALRNSHRHLSRPWDVPGSRRAARHRRLHHRWWTRSRATREKDDLEEERHRLALLKSQLESGARLPEWQERAGLHDTLLNLRRLLKEE